MIRVALAVTASVLALASPASAQTFLNATFDGTLTTSQKTPDPGKQTFTLTGNFLTYSASSDLPQLNGNDLNRYSFTVTGLSQAFNAATNTVTYGDVTGTISGYGEVVQTLAPTTLTVAFDSTFTTAALLGTLMSTGKTTPAGFPGPIDFSPANGAQITGSYLTNGVQGGTVLGAITFPAAAAVPEAATWATMIAGLGMAGVALRRRQRVSVRFA